MTYHATLVQDGKRMWQVRMRVWQRDGSGERVAAPLIDARSAACAVEVGGGPWWDSWRAEVCPVVGTKGFS